MRSLPCILAVVSILAAGIPLLAPTAEAVPTVTYRVQPAAYRPINLTEAAQSQGGSQPDNFFSSILPIGFATTFFGERTEFFWISANGFLTMIDPQPNGCCEGGSIPSPDGPDGIVAGFWTDLDPFGGHMKFENFPAPANAPFNDEGVQATQVLVTEWNASLKDDVFNKQVFQIHVYDNGVYEVHWTRVDASGLRPATVGIEDHPGRVGVEFARSATFARSNAAISFIPTIADLPPPTPSISHVAPSSARPQEEVRVFGNDFIQQSQVFLGGAAAPTSFVSPTELSVRVPTLPEGPADVRVVNVDLINGNRSAILAGGLTVLPALAVAPYALETIPFAPLVLSAPVAVALTDEEVTSAIPLGFETTFFGETTQALRISSNGFVGLLESIPPGCCGHPIPDVRSPDGIVAGFWGDLDPASGGAIRREALTAPSGEDVFVVSFENVPLSGNPFARQTFQIHVYESGIIEVHLLSVTADHRNASIGIEDRTGVNGLAAFLGASTTLSEVAFRFTPGSLGPDLQVDAIVPSSGPVGSAVDVLGAGFDAGATVRLGGVLADAVVLDDTRIQVIVPSLAEGLVDVEVANPGGANVTVPGGFEVTSGSGGFALSAVSPSSGAVGATVAVLGSGFSANATVFLGGAPANASFVHSGQLNAVVPQLPTGTVDVRVVNGDGAEATLPAAFAVTEPCVSDCSSAPFVVSLTPASGPVGTRVLVDGGDFQPGAVAFVGGVAATTTFRASTSLEVVIPSSLSPGVSAFVVSNPDGGTASARGGFEVKSVPPTITFAAPAQGRPGDEITVFGSGFQAGARVFVGGAEATVRSLSGTSIRILVPDAPAGLTSLRVLNPNGATGFLGSAFTLLRGPQISGVVNTTVRHGQELAVTGTGFQTGDVLAVGGVPLANATVTPTRISARVGLDVPRGVHDVAVVSRAGSATLPAAVLVLRPVDLAVTDVSIIKPRMEVESVGVPLDPLFGQKIRVELRNEGDDPARNVRVNFYVRTDSASRDMFGRPADSFSLFAQRSVERMEPGASATIEITWFPPQSYGDYVLRVEALAQTGEARLDNNARETSTNIVVKGVRGFNSCDVRASLRFHCDKGIETPLTQRATVRRETDATDHHVRATARFDVKMAAPRFDFDFTDRIFDTTREEPDGSTRECTVWRFFGGRGEMHVNLTTPEGFEGFVQVPAAASRSSEGTITTRTRTTHLLGNVELTRTDDVFTQPAPNSPQTEYTFPPLELITVDGEGLKGDFTRCTITSPSGQRSERFVFAALPTDLEQREPSFEGFGTAESLHVRRVSTEHSSSSQPIYIPIGGF